LEALLWGLGGLALIGLIHYSGVWRGRRTSRESRVSRVVEEYGRLAHGPTPVITGLRGFIRAGAKSLESTAEVLEAVEQIEQRYGRDRHPLSRERDQLRRHVQLLEIIRQIEPDGSNVSEVYAAYRIKWV
jgi:hypothetical protein